MYVRVSLRRHNLGTFYARKFKFGMLLTQTETFNCMLELFLGHALGEARDQKVYQIEHFENSVEMFASRYCHVGRDQRAEAFVYF